MSANPWAAVGFVILVILMWGSGSPSAVMTGVFLLYVPAWLACSYLWDMFRFRNQENGELK